MGIRQVEWDEKVQNLKKKEKQETSKVKSVDFKQVDQMMSTPNVNYSLMSQREAPKKQVRRGYIQ